MAAKKWVLYEPSDDRVVALVFAETGEEAIDQYDPTADPAANWDTQWDPTAIRVYAYLIDASTEEGASRLWILPQNHRTPPRCDHQWDEEPAEGGPGSILVWVDSCRACGVRRETTFFPAERGRRRE